MNRKALAIGMQETQFADASGLSAGNVSTPKDLLSLAQYIHKQNPFIFRLTEAAQKTVANRGTGNQTSYTNNHPLHSNRGFVGGKNGYTDEAEHTLLSVFSADIHEETRPIAIIVLGSERHVEDTTKLLNWTRSL
jgi:D-alanyl-D-alanine carboxypeptidase